MSTVTLAESAKLAQNELTAGVIEDIITLNSMFAFMPFDSFTGNALQYTREATLGGAGAIEVGNVIGTADENALDVALGGGGTGLARDPATFTTVTAGLTTLLGQADVNNLIQATRSGDGNDQAAIQISSKAKHLGRLYQHLLVEGNDTNAEEFDGLKTILAAVSGTAQDVATGTNGGALSFAFLDELCDLVTSKDGQVDFLMMPKRTIRAYKALLRALGGTTPGDTSMDVIGTDGTERTILAYDGIPIFRNDFIPVNVTKGSSSNTTSIYAGCFDDGSRSNGIAGLTSEVDAGIEVVDVGESETKDEHIWRVKWYCGLAVFSEKGLARAEGITN